MQCIHRSRWIYCQANFNIWSSLPIYSLTVVILFWYLMGTRDKRQELCAISKNLQWQHSVCTEGDCSTDVSVCSHKTLTSTGSAGTQTCDPPHHLTRHFWLEKKYVIHYRQPMLSWNLKIYVKFRLILLYSIFVTYSMTERDRMWQHDGGKTCICHKGQHNRASNKQH